MVRLKGSSKFTTIKCKFISIPYGAIKRVLPITLRLLRSKFQFLMVRLKGSYSVSAIDKKKFQFLMVRLKVKTILPCNANKIFQFLMVRLKG